MQKCKNFPLSPQKRLKFSFKAGNSRNVPVVPASQNMLATVTSKFDE